MISFEHKVKPWWLQLLGCNERTDQMRLTLKRKEKMHTRVTEPRRRSGNVQQGTETEQSVSDEVTSQNCLGQLITADPIFLHDTMAHDHTQSGYKRLRRYLPDKAWKHGQEESFQTPLPPGIPLVIIMGRHSKPRVAETTL